MSARNGDRSRFNRERKQKIARRKRTRDLVEEEIKSRRLVNAAARTKPGPVSA
jgi:hypothetical protein